MAAGLLQASAPPTPPVTGSHGAHPPLSTSTLQLSMPLATTRRPPPLLATPKPRPLFPPMPASAA